MDNRISGTTELYGVFGSPIAHSKSPFMYNVSFDHYEMDKVYLAFQCEKEGVDKAINAVRSLNIKGGNVTMPCKQAFAERMDELSPAARLVGAVNTFTNENGHLTGHITDGMGVVLDLKDHDILVSEKNIVMLGAGGAAGAIFVQLCLEGAKSIHLFNRSETGLQKMKDIGERIKEDGYKSILEYSLLEDEEGLTEAVLQADILIQCTSVGMAGVSEGESLIKDLRAFHEGLSIYDIVYNPPVTKLMEDALKSGVPAKKVIGGKGMLLWQGYEAFKIFTGKEMPVREIESSEGYAI